MKELYNLARLNRTNLETRMRLIALIAKLGWPYRGAYRVLLDVQQIMSALTVLPGDEIVSDFDPGLRRPPRRWLYELQCNPNFKFMRHLRQIRNATDLQEAHKIQYDLRHTEEIRLTEEEWQLLRMMIL
jgi:hypothetical protein